MVYYRGIQVCCTTCGFCGKTPVEVEDTDKYSKPKKFYQKCPKCSNKAMVNYTFWSPLAINILVKEIVSLKNDVFELECQIEQLVDPVDYGN